MWNPSRLTQDTLELAIKKRVALQQDRISLEPRVIFRSGITEGEGRCLNGLRKSG